jgi:ParB family chromosome partitioning protein
METLRLELVLLDLIRCEAQVRRTVDPKHLERLTRSVAEHGVIVPVLLRRDAEGQLWMVDGHLRLLAAREAGHSTLPSVVQDTPRSKADIIAVQLTTAIQRRDLSPIDKAAALRELMTESGMTAAQVAAKLAMSPAGVSRLLRLLELPEPIKRRVAAREIPASTGYLLATVDDADTQAVLAGEVADGTLTRDGVSKRRRTEARPTCRQRPRRTTASIGSFRLSMPTAATAESFVLWLETTLTRARAALPQCPTLEAMVGSLAAQDSEGGRS